MPPKRAADLSDSTNQKFLRCKKYLENIAQDYTVTSCLKMIKAVCEKRNAALQGNFCF